MTNPISRRALLRAAGVGAVAASAPAATAAPTDTLVATLWKSLTPAQRKTVAFPFDHPLRAKVDNAWQITQPIKEVFSRDQQAMLREIFRGLHSAEHAQRIWDATVHDQEGDGFEGGCSVALFGAPSERLELVLSGRHVTRRASGDTADGVAFGGPIFYGHQAGPDDEEPATHPGNAYWFQAVRANSLYKVLDGKQRKLALQSTYRGEQGARTVELSGKRTGLKGLPVSTLTRDQKAELSGVLGDLLAPFRQADADEVRKLVEAQLDAVHLSYFDARDLGGDKVWDVWQLEGPSMVWFYRGAPHVHVWAHVRKPA